jgi:hypothetical protein
MLFIKKITDDKNLSSYLSQGDGGLKKNSPYLMKFVREQYMKVNQTEPRSLFLHIYSEQPIPHEICKRAVHESESN